MNRPGVRVKTRALDTWRAELRAGQRTATTLDVLWRAACLEASALESTGTPGTAARYLAEARRLLSPSGPTAFDLAARHLRRSRRKFA
jgi:hypothetical protein